jgi:hypothetical protein
LQLATLFEQWGETSEAAALYEKASESPHTIAAPAGAMGLGLLRVQHGPLEEAWAPLEHALELANPGGRTTDSTIRIIRMDQDLGEDQNFELVFQLDEPTSDPMMVLRQGARLLGRRRTDEILDKAANLGDQRLQAVAIRLREALREGPHRESAGT